MRSQRLWQRNIFLQSLQHLIDISPFPCTYIASTSTHSSFQFPADSKMDFHLDSCSEIHFLGPHPKHNIIIGTWIFQLEFSLKKFLSTVEIGIHSYYLLWIEHRGWYMRVARKYRLRMLVWNCILFFKSPKCDWIILYCLYLCVFFKRLLEMQKWSSQFLLVFA